MQPILDPTFLQLLTLRISPKFLPLNLQSITNAGQSVGMEHAFDTNNNDHHFLVLQCVSGTVHTSTLGTLFHRIGAVLTK